MTKSRCTMGTCANVLKFYEFICEAYKCKKCMQYFDLFCFCGRQDAVHSPKSVSNFNLKSLERALVFYNLHGDVT